MLSLLTTIAQSFSCVASEFQAHNSKIFVLLLKAKIFVLGFGNFKSNKVSNYSSSLLSYLFIANSAVTIYRELVYAHIASKSARKHSSFYSTTDKIQIGFWPKI